LDVSRPEVTPVAPINPLSQKPHPVFKHQVHQITHCRNMAIEISKMAAGRHLGFSWIWGQLLFMSYSFVFGIAHDNQLKKNLKSTNLP